MDDNNKGEYCECNTLNKMGCQSYAAFCRAFSDRMDSMVRIPHRRVSERDPELAECYRWRPDCQLYENVRVYIFSGIGR